eukprot:COSAG06_NODE_1307_length_9916_cov_99.462361_19_plen_60_part_00
MNTALCWRILPPPPPPRTCEPSESLLLSCSRYCLPISPSVVRSGSFSMKAAASRGNLSS